MGGFDEPGVECWTTVDGTFAVFVVPVEVRRPAALPLTPAERAVVAQVLEGRSNAEIAAARGCSARTVANQLRSVYQKLGVGSRVELARRLAATRLDHEPGT